MKRIMLVGAALWLTASPGDTLARGSESLENVPYAVKARCDTLMQRFNEAAAHPPNAGNLAAAKSAASQGGALCRTARYEEGGETLAKALRLIGAPAD
jgi:hypothetical protein